MFLNNYHQIKNKEIYVVLFLILFSIIIRLPAVFMFGDTNIENEWGSLYKNLIIHGKLIYENFGETLLPMANAIALDASITLPPPIAITLSIFFDSDNKYASLIILISGSSLIPLNSANLNFLSKFLILVKLPEDFRLLFPYISNGYFPIWDNSFGNIEIFPLPNIVFTVLR